MSKLKEWFKRNWNTEDSIDGLIRVEREFINANRQRAIEHLNNLGWNILSTDERVCFYSFKIQKGEHIINSVGIKEALLIK